ncbi:ATP-binding cassette domain-containing protein [Undibacterium crateris]|uniref:ATP-binding cassette domain-containing protein n=1 Tax=Undibacterium crateris TaxID=2528175 RepID=UPI00138A2911|nr:ATP-binding cassette domain-containing protein [Undibacterium crateris]NDI85715.1 ATP-binding cassette domain-containing protein [Undibacterium crateris]
MPLLFNKDGAAATNASTATAATAAAEVPGAPQPWLVEANHLVKRYGAHLALDHISLQVRPGEIYGLIGPDGAGKSSLLKAVAGVLAHDEGELRVFSQLIRNEADSELIKDRIGLMPQGLGQNLYGDLSVEENIDYFGGLRLLSAEALRERKEALLKSTRLERFRDRPMKNLSGGMKQKLGLVCTLIHEPKLVILDEPTTGVDPVSRREFWSILSRLLQEKGITALVSTAYMDEASRFHRVSLMHEGKILASGEPARMKDLAAGCIVSTICADAQQQMAAVQRLTQRFPQLEALGQEIRVFVDSADADADAARQQVLQTLQQTPAIAQAQTEVLDAELEDVFIALLRQRAAADANVAEPVVATVANTAAVVSVAQPATQQLAIEARELSRHFGEFKAVDQVSFQVPQGEIFGLLGANGAGKSTVIKMLTGILTQSSGQGMVAGADMRTAGLQIRERIGYMSQAFSLYLDLSVLENIRLYAGIYGLSRQQTAERMDWILDMAGLRPFGHALTASLPMGLRQRLALGCALIHRPQVLFLDEPTSGVDPLGRRAFWDVLFRLSREEHVTILVTTHYMSEAEHCDHIALMYAGRVVADASPEQLKNRLEQEAGQLVEVDCTDAPQALQVLQQAGFASASLFGPKLHVLLKDPETDSQRVRTSLQAFEVSALRPRRLSMEDVFVHIVTSLEQQDAQHQKGSS